MLAIRRQGALVRRRRGSPRRRAGDLPGRRRQDRDQGQVDDRRGNRHQRPSGTARHHPGRDRPRRIHHPASARTAQPHHRPGLPSEHGGLGGGLSQSPHRPAARPTVQRTPRRPDRGPHQAARKVPRRRRRHHRRQLPDRRDRQQRHRHQRRQRRPDADLAAGPHRAGQHREMRADAGGCHLAAAGAGAIRHRPGFFRLYHVLHRRAPAGRSGRAGGIPRRADRQRPVGDDRHRVPGDAALHPLRRLHEPLPGLWRGRRPCLWLGVSGSDGRGADTRA